MPTLAKDLKPGMLVDMAFCPYLTDKSDNVDASSIYARVEGVTEIEEGVTLVAFVNFTNYALPSDLQMILDKDDEGNNSIINPRFGRRP